jgi:hypothetical protein
MVQICFLRLLEADEGSIKENDKLEQERRRWRGILVHFAGYTLPIPWF